ncbi:MAG: isopentenyl-diphosphate Delta-isomerase [Candidatus Thermoplasmatota archaeon]|nr:isopentenyl-diphosphate Delta-isomerase [Candidatus Thermoplasmatota archaeon]
MSDHQQIILVDENDNQIGTDEKISAHSNGGKLHRAFSVFIFNSDGKLLLQQRSKEKYHAPLMWANTCCSHPYPGEKTMDAAHRRLREELGFDCDLVEAFSFTYHEPVGNNLTEWEFDHVFFGRYDGKIEFNRSEVESIRWVDLSELRSDINRNPEIYAPWLRICLDRVVEKYSEIYHK